MISYPRGFPGLARIPFTAVKNSSTWANVVRAMTLPTLGGWERSISQRGDIVVDGGGGLRRVVGVCDGPADDQEVGSSRYSFSGCCYPCLVVGGDSLRRIPGVTFSNLGATSGNYSEFSDGGDDPFAAGVLGEPAPAWP